MAISTDQFVSVLNDLIETCKDGERGFRESAEAVQNPAVRDLFLQCSTQRAKYAQELQAHVLKLGQAPETSGSASGTLHRGWINLKSAMTGRDDQAIINEAERGEDVAMETYQAALAKDMPSDLKAVIAKQYSGVQAAHDQVRALKHGQTL